VPEETLPISLCSDHPMLRRAGVAILAVLIAAAMVSGNALLGAPSAYAAAPSLGLGTSASFAILAGTAVNSTGVSTVSGDIGTSPARQ
jgi:Na+/H+ antiporter NhaD/arsenite permease-like protein